MNNLKVYNFKDLYFDVLSYFEGTFVAKIKKRLFDAKQAFVKVSL